MPRIKHGFSGQQMLIMPYELVNGMERNPLVNDLIIRSLGYFPTARHHYIDRPHGCPEHVLIYCVKGKGWFETCGNRQTLSENMFVLLEASKSHKYGADSKTPWSIYWLHFKGDKANLFSAFFNRATAIPPDDNSRIDNRIKLFEEMFNVLSESFSPDNLNYAHLCLGHFLGTLFYLDTYRNAAGKVYLYSNSTVNRATHFINENLDKKLTIKMLTDIFGYSPSYFYRIFRKETGYAPMDYVNRMRVQRACYYLLNSTLRINQVSYKVGYDDPYYFSRIFKRITGMSPKEYRRKQEGQSFMQ
ncbi:MAG: AraC family transcriptional regulator [Tannerella sp.]|jgi:AraC-like DNA-binding protein|nr:AraC family transcriptional regulator [Tannerella sp.]